MLLSIQQAFDALADRLHAYFAAHDFQWKSSSALDDFTAAKPTVYKFCVPPADINDQQMPTKCPCVLLALTKWRKHGASSVYLDLAINCVVVDAATLDKETAYPQGDGTYALGDGADYAQSAESLYKAALLLAECVVDAISLMSHTAHAPLSIEIKEFDPPHALLEDYPYAVCVVPATVRIINNSAKDLSYENYL